MAAWFVGLVVLFGLGVFGESRAQMAVQTGLVCAGGWLLVVALARLMMRVIRRR